MGMKSAKFENIRFDCNNGKNIQLARQLGQLSAQILSSTSACPSPEQGFQSFDLKTLSPSMSTNFGSNASSAPPSAAIQLPINAQQLGFADVPSPQLRYQHQQLTYLQQDNMIHHAQSVPNLPVSYLPQAMMHASNNPSQQLQFVPEPTHLAEFEHQLYLQLIQQQQLLLIQQHQQQLQPQQEQALPATTFNMTHAFNHQTQPSQSLSVTAPSQSNHSMPRCGGGKRIHLPSQPNPLIEQHPFSHPVFLNNHPFSSPLMVQSSLNQFPHQAPSNNSKLNNNTHNNYSHNLNRR